MFISFEEAVKILKREGIVAFPTDTAYGILGNAYSEKVAEKIYEIKQRDKNKKSPILTDNIEKIEKIGEIGEIHKYLSKKIHPAPLSIAIKSDKWWVGAFRIPNNILTLNLLNRLDFPLIATSANISGKEALYSAEDVEENLDIPVFNGGILEKGKISTVYDPVKDVVYRRGSYPINLIRAYKFAFDALEKIKPNKDEKEKIYSIYKEVSKVIEKYHKDFILGGSVAKDTFLKSSADLDIFLLFDKNEDLNNKIDLFKKIAHGLNAEYKIEYSQHPYLQVFYKNYKIELVPAYKTDNVISAADRSIWHVKFVSKFDEDLKDEIRILKAFLKGIGSYGADLKNRGFSGYACEILTYLFGDFVKVLINIQKFSKPFFLPDPTDFNRDILSSVSPEKFELFKIAAREYLKNPSLKFFFPKKLTLPILPYFENLFFIELEPKKEYVEDALWGIGHRLSRKLFNNLELEQFEPKFVRHFVLNNKIYLFGKAKLKNKFIIYEGPRLSDKTNILKFKEKNKYIFEAKNRLYAIKESKFENLKDFIKKIIREDPKVELSLYLEKEDLFKKYLEFNEELKGFISKELLNIYPWEV